MERHEVKQKIQYYYQLKREAIVKQKELNKLQYIIDGVKGVSYGDVHGGGLDRGHKIVAGMERKEEMEAYLDKHYMEMALLWSELHMNLLTDEDNRLLDKVFLEGLSYDKVAEEIGYASKVGVHRRLKKIYDKIGK